MKTPVSPLAVLIFLTLSVSVGGCSGKSTAGPMPVSEATSAVRVSHPREVTDSPAARNLILLIGDGMGLAQIHAAAAVRQKPLAMLHYDHMGLMQTQAASHYVTDSAAAATAMATGVATRNGFLGLDPNQLPLVSILTLAQQQKKQTGIVVTTSAVHATPAGFFAQQPNRNDAMNIALDFVASPPDVFIGGGRKYFTNRPDGRDLLAKLRSKDIRIALNPAELNAIENGRVAAFLFDTDPPRIATGRGRFLPDAVQKAIDLLSPHEGGFFLMVEGAQIDWAGHERDLTWQIEETLDFDDAVAVALTFARNRNDTIVIVTADHETGALFITGGNEQARTVEGRFGSTDHTGIMVPVFASGPGAQRFSGTYRNTDLFDRMKAVLDL